MQESKITRILFVTLFIFTPFLSLHSEDGDSQRLQQVQEKSIEELSEYFRRGKTKADYTEEQSSTIDGIKEGANQRINASIETEDVLKILDEAKKDIDRVETSQELQENIEKLKADLEKYLKSSPESSTYTDERFKEIESIKENYGNEIDHSTDTSDANTQFEEAKQKIDEVPTSLEQLSLLEADYTILEEKVGQLESELVKKQDVKQFIIKKIFSLLAIFLVLLITAYIVISYFNFKKYKIANSDKVKLLENSINDLYESFENSRREINDNIQLLTEESKERKVKPKTEITINNPKVLPKPVDLPKTVEIIPADPIEDYNNWAADPSRPLPNRFYYLRGKIKVRTEQSFSAASDIPTEWICNKRTDKHYLLPNPNFFDELTNIKSFYKMDVGQLKPKGRNKIKVIEPCKMSDKGWIDNPGELEFK